MLPSLAELQLTLRHPAHDPLRKQRASELSCAHAPGAVEVLCAALPGLARLRSLDLSNSQAGPEGTAALAGVLYALRMLTCVRFANNQAGTALPQLVRQASALPALQQLDLSHNNGEAASLCTLAACASDMTALKTLAFGPCEVGAGGVPEQSCSGATFVKHMTSLCHVSLHGLACVFAGTQCPFSGLSDLQHLDLVGSRLPLKCFETMMGSLCRQSNLTYLALTLAIAQHDVFGEDLRSALQQVQWPLLQKLAIDDEEESSKLHLLLKHLAPCEQLTRLDLDTKVLGVPSDGRLLSRHTALQALQLQVHSTNADNLEQLIGDLAKLRDLSSLCIACNQCLSDYDGRVTAVLQACTALTQVKLDSCVPCEMLSGLTGLRSQLQSVHLKEVDVDDSNVCTVTI